MDYYGSFFFLIFIAVRLYSWKLFVTYATVIIFPSEKFNIDRPSSNLGLNLTLKFFFSVVPVPFS